MDNGFRSAFSSRHSQLFAAFLILLSFMAERPYVFIKLPSQLAERGWLKIAYFISLISVGWLLCFLLYLYAAKSVRAVKWLVFALLAASSAFFDIFYVISGHALMYQDFLALRQEAGYSEEALSQFYPLFAYSFARLLILLCAFLIMERRKGASVKAVSLLLASVLVFAGVCIIKRGAVTDFLPAAIGLYGLDLATAFDINNRKYVYSGAPYPSHPVGDVNIILVIDESVRADFLSGDDLKEIFSGYPGDWRYYDFGVATAGANCSAPSKVLLRKSIRPYNVANDLYNNPLIWDYAANAGFTTYLADARDNGKGDDHFDPHELKLVSHIIDAESAQWDVQVLDLMKFLWLPGKTFSMVIKKGAHFPYSRDFPASHTISVHSDYVAADQKRIDYMKAVDWQTKGFLKKLISFRFDKPTVVIYTSDHGQNLDDQPGATHCTASAIPFAGEGLVPLVVFTNYDDGRLDAAVGLNYDTLSHFNIFPTILAYMGFDVEGKGTNYSLPMYRDVHPLNKFIYSSPFGRFGSVVKFVDVSAVRNFVLKRDAPASAPALADPARPRVLSRVDSGVATR